MCHRNQPLKTLSARENSIQITTVPNVRERSQLRESVHKCAELLFDPTELLVRHQSLQDLISHQSIAQIIQMNTVTGENSLLDVH
jgi:hypothetical protein